MTAYSAFRSAKANLPRRNSDRKPLENSPKAEACEHDEYGLLGCTLLDPVSCVPILRKHGVTPEMLEDGRREAILSLMFNLVEEKGVKQFDDVFLASQVHQAGIGGVDAKFFSDLRDAVPSAANLEYYIDPVKQAFRARKTKECAQLVIRSVERGLSVSEVLREFERLKERVEGYSGLPDPVDAADFLEIELEPLAEIIEGILYKQSKLVLSGASKAGKSWILIDLAISVATGTRWLDIPTALGRVLYVNLELSKQTFQKRLKSVCKAKGIDRSTLRGQLTIWNLRGHNSNYETLLPRIKSAAKKAGYSLIIIDPVYKLYGGLKENAAEDMAILHDALGELMEQTGAALAIATHHSKGNQAKKDSIDRAVGSGVTGRDLDSSIDFTENEKENAFSVSLILREFAPIKGFGVRWEWPLFRRDETVDPTKLKHKSGANRQHNPIILLAAIKDTTSESPISVSGWAKRCGIARQTLDGYLEDLREDGLTGTAGDGCKARKYITAKGLEAVARLEQP